jgi:hypothetical protein
MNHDDDDLASADGNYDDVGKTLNLDSTVLIRWPCMAMI